MSIARIAAWGVVALLTYMPVNWIILGISGGLPADSSISQLLLGGLFCWGIAGGLAYFLVMSAKGLRMQAAKQEKRLQDLAQAPLTEITPSRAMLKPGEKAYGAATASLLENKVVGYQAGTSGVSVRVAKGVTVRAGGMRGGSVKDWVTVAEGELVITDRRVVFAGDRKSFSIAFDDLLSVTPYSDGFAFGDERTTRTVIINGDGARKVMGIVLDKVLGERKLLANAS